jgi:hypothetical protein
MQNLTRELAALSASVGTRHDWTRRRELPRGYAAYVGNFGHVPLTRIADIAAAALLDASRGRDVAITLTCGSTTLGTVSVDRYTYAWAASRAIDPDGFVPRALLAHLWASAHATRR